MAVEGAENFGRLEVVEAAGVCTLDPSEEQAKSKELKHVPLIVLEPLMAVEMGVAEEGWGAEGASDCVPDEARLAVEGAEHFGRSEAATVAEGWTLDPWEKRTKGKKLTPAPVVVLEPRTVVEMGIEKERRVPTAAYPTRSAWQWRQKKTFGGRRWRRRRGCGH